VLLEIAIPKEQLVLGFVNISHIPYSKFEEVFKDEITENQRFLFEDTGEHIIHEALYEKYSHFLIGRLILYINQCPGCLWQYIQWRNKS